MANEKIVVLQGPDRVRKRPAVIFMSDEIEGVQNAVRILLEIFAVEAQLGRCKHLLVKQNGADLEISGDDRGIYLGQDNGDDSVWKNTFCELYAASACAPDESGYSFGLRDASHCALYGDEIKPNSIYLPTEHGLFELCAIQYASEYMDVCVNRDGVKSTLHFQKGYNIGGILNEATEEQNGTCFRFKMDREVFTQTVLPASFFTETLDAFAMLSPGLNCKYVNAVTGKEVEFFYPHGMKDYVQAKGSTAPVYIKKIEAKGKERYNRAEYEACVEVAIGDTSFTGNTRCIHNFRELTYGGTHYEQLQKQVCRAFNDCFQSCIASDDSLTFDELSKHLTVILATWCSPYCSVWENGIRLSIKNKLITDMTYDAVGRAFCDYVYAHRETLQRIVDAILEERK